MITFWHIAACSGISLQHRAVPPSKIKARRRIAPSHDAAIAPLHYLKQPSRLDPSEGLAKNQQQSRRSISSGCSGHMMQCGNEFVRLNQKRLAAIDDGAILSRRGIGIEEYYHGDDGSRSPFYVWDNLRSVSRRADRSRQVRVSCRHAHPSSLALSQVRRSI